MVIFDLGICHNVDLKFCRLICCFLANIGKLKFGSRFDRGLTLLISGSDCDSGSWCRLVLSFGICMQNMSSFEVG